MAKKPAKTPQKAEEGDFDSMDDAAADRVWDRIGQGESLDNIAAGAKDDSEPDHDEDD